MALFGRKKTEFPKMPEGDFEPVLRCSICTGEQTLCVREKQSGKLHELMLIRRPEELAGFCAANGLDINKVEKIY